MEHWWIAVYIEDSWRLIDPTWGAGESQHIQKMNQKNVLGEYNDQTKEYTKKINEYYFLTDPEEFSSSHLPWKEDEDDYEKWQLLEDPISLDQFNASPHFSSTFFDFNLELLDIIPSPWIINESGVIRIKSWETFRYKVH